jgi:hypothetical protein
VENSENPKKRGWTIVRKAQVIGAVFGALFAIVVLIYCQINPPRFWDFAGYLLMLVQAPTILICNALGLSPNSLYGKGSGNLTNGSFCLLVFNNALLFGLLGTIIGWMRQRHAKRR